jgi:hypothetical protein
MTDCASTPSTETTCFTLVGRAPTERFAALMAEMQPEFAAAGCGGRPSGHATLRDLAVRHRLLMEETGVQGDQSLLPDWSARCDDLTRWEGDDGNEVFFDDDAACDADDDA